MTTPLLTFDEFRLLTVMPASDVDALEAVAPGWIASQLEYWTAQIYARLRKRYAVPFVAPFPIAAKGWLARIVTVRCYLRRGVDPNDLQFDEIKKDAEAATAEIKEAADSNTGLFDLPLREDTTATGATLGGPFGYAEQSPYVFMDRQVDIGRNEDSNRGGSYG